MRYTALLPVVAVIALAGCGGSAKLSQSESYKASTAQFEATVYCIRQRGLGQPETGNIAENVDVLVKAWKDHGDAKLEGGRRLKSLLRQAQTALATCAPEQAKKIDDALAGG